MTTLRAEPTCDSLRPLSSSAIPIIVPVRSLSFSFLLAVLLVLYGAAPAVAQPEIVPAEHPIYDFLHQQRVRGLLPEYRHEVRPTGWPATAANSSSRRTRWKP